MKQPLKIIPVKPSLNDSVFTECFTGDNFNYLYECAAHYAGLLGKTLKMPKGAVYERINTLYHHFAGILPEGQGLNVETDDGRLMWAVYHAHQWENLTFYWMPVKFVTRLSGAIREIAMSFINRFIRGNGLVRFSQSYEYEYFFESASESIACGDYTETEADDLDDMLQSYFNGEIAGLLDEVYDYQPLDVAGALEEYRPANPPEAKLIDCFRKGIPFISGESIMRYEYDRYGECDMLGYDDDPPVTLDRIIRYVYELNDFVSNEIEYMVNHYLRETYPVEPATYMILNPSSKLLVPGDYPERFSAWFLEMVNVLNGITGHE